MFIIDLFVVLVFVVLFIGTAEIIYWSYKKEYLKAKAKYLRSVIDQKNDASSTNEPFYSCVYEKWNTGEMPLSEATAVCKLKLRNI